ncbi:MAG: hypothetical protein LC797_00805 [Chloroflexi bacterium]|nr:hypothetical protein [Chloroflexota bacterium]
MPRAAARDVDAGGNLQVLLVSAVVAVLLTRLYLGLTGFPRVGGGGLHIAHLLWGGLLMLSALVLLLAVLGKRAKRWGAVLGGLGFGLFVDELGKFVTDDNNYFFQPAIALIYVLFIVLFLVFRAIERRSLSADELLINAADMLREVILGGATRAEVVRARRLLDRSGFEGPLADALSEAIDSAARAPERVSAIATAARSAWRTYDHLLDWRWFPRAIWIIFVAQAVLGLLAAIGVGSESMHNQTPPLQLATLTTSVVSLVLVLTGVMRLPRSRLDAYRWFERGVLVSILLTQVLIFWQDQLAALGGLLWDLALLTALRFLAKQEEARVVLKR